MKVVSWNVNGIRAAQGKGFLDWLRGQDADLVFLQETKARVEQLDLELIAPSGWSSAFHSGERKGYSGVAVYWRKGHDPDEVLVGIGEPKFDAEGRVIGVRYGDYVVYANYFPNGGQGPERIAYKLEFYDAFLQLMNRHRAAGRKVCVGGDYNTAHREIDLARPKENETTSGFLPEERAWIDRYVEECWLDTFRYLHPDEPDRYSWWSFRMNARARNIGWRIDYWFIDQAMAGEVRAAQIYENQQGSDHAPVTLELG